VAFAKGVLPDGVIRDVRAEGLLVFVTLDSNLSRESAQQWLMQVEGIVRRLVAPVDGLPVARVAVGFGRSFFLQGDQPRFELSERAPLGLRQPPETGAEDRLEQADLVFYVMTTSEAAAAEFLESLSLTRASGLVGISIERGFQRNDGREIFGFLDGLRNLTFHERFRHVFVNRDRYADEPDWTEDGTYLAYLKIEQHLDVWRSLGVDRQETLMGRRKADGSRLDLPPGSHPRSEREFVGDPPSPASHVRKAGPRGVRDEARIFRRGLPYFGLNSDGSPDAGLHFVSFQASAEQFDAVLNTWMLNPDFPAAGTQVDSLFGQDPRLVTIRRGGLFFVPPAPRFEGFLGAQIFEPPKPEAEGRKTGKLFVRKKAVTPEGRQARIELRGILFEVTDPATGASVAERFGTDAAGHALSPPLPVNKDKDLLLNEVVFPPNLQPASPITFRVRHRRQALMVTNFLRQPGPYGT
jgi:Dyp-type peroxidase family